MINTLRIDPAGSTNLSMDIAVEGGVTLDGGERVLLTMEQNNKCMTFKGVRVDRNASDTFSFDVEDTAKMFNIEEEVTFIIDILISGYHIKALEGVIKYEDLSILPEVDVKVTMADEEKAVELPIVKENVEKQSFELLRTRSIEDKEDVTVDKDVGVVEEVVSGKGKIKEAVDALISVPRDPNIVKEQTQLAIKKALLAKMPVISERDKKVKNILSSLKKKDTKIIK